MIRRLVTLGDREQDWVGAVFAKRYAVESRIGSGASATVYRANDTDESRMVALKISRPFVLTKHRRAARFLREVQAVQRIDHPGCAQVLDWGIERDCAYIVMELIDADDLFAVIQREAPMEELQALAIAISICDVLDAAHALGVVHRDLKPRNVMVMREAEPAREGARPERGVKVLDFGLAKLMRMPADDEGTLPLDLTKPGAVLGTPHYMAPEQVRDGGTIDGRADLYAVAVMLYEMVTARRPLEERNAVRALIAIGTQKPIPPSEHQSDLDSALERAILRGLEKDPSSRFATAAEMGNVLRGIGDRLAEDHAPTSMYRAKKRAVARTKKMPVEDLESDTSDDEQLTRVQRSGDKPSAADPAEEEVLTRVYKPGESRRAPKMVAKPAPPVTSPAPLSTPSAAPKPDVVAPEDEDHTVVMRVEREERPQKKRTPRRKRIPERSETEKGVRAALLTITVAALTAALGRWLSFW